MQDRLAVHGLAPEAAISRPLRGLCERERTMLRQAEERDRAALLDWLRREPEFNLFIIGDILTYGMRSEEIEVFIESRRGLIEAVLLRFRENFIPAARDDSADLAAIAGRINTALAAAGRRFVSGKREVVERVQPLLQRRPSTVHDQFFSVCRELKAEVPLGALPLVRAAGGADADGIAALWDDTFGKQERLRLRDDIERGVTRAALVRAPESGEIASAAAAVAESDSAAMIIGVATHPDHRRKGYATACVYRLVEDLRAKGKSACLFFHNPAAGTIYHRLGFTDIGMWKMLKFER